MGRLFGKSKPVEKQQPIPENNRQLNKKNIDTAKVTPRVIKEETLHVSQEDKSTSSLFNRFQKKGSETKSDSLKQDRTVIGKTVQVTGEISGGEEVIIEGKVHGDIFILSKLSIGISGVVDGKIEAQNVKISGKAKGEINARNKIELAATGDVYGKLITPRIIVMEGASIDSSIKTTKQSKSNFISANEKTLNVKKSVSKSIISVDENVTSKLPQEKQKSKDLASENTAINTNTKNPILKPKKK